MKIGLIAGGGQFPILFARKATAGGYGVVACGFPSQTDEDLVREVTNFQWLHLGQVSRLLKYFRSHGIDRAVMLGTIQKTRLFQDIRPDLKAMAFIARNGLAHDDGILTTFADLMQQEGIEICPSTFLLPELISPEGCWTDRHPDRAEKKDAELGWRLAREIGRLDIGQCVVISHGMILAVEAVDGTDATIERGGRLARGNGAVVVKLSKPGQDLRFDLPSTGTETIRTMIASGVTALVLEAGRSISFDRDEMVALANAHRIAILALTEPCAP